jgi:hypothetical protein
MSRRRNRPDVRITDEDTQEKIIWEWLNNSCNFKDHDNTNAQTVVDRINRRSNKQYHIDVDVFIDIKEQWRKEIRH